MTRSASEGEGTEAPQVLAREMSVPNERPLPLFLFSLPRSGSTLVQRILALQDEIATVSEPWILLPYFYTLRDRGVYAEYNHTSMVRSVEDFCEGLDGGREDYVEEVRELALRLYAKAATGGERYFLDKTPRYHVISGDLMDAFRDAKHVFLWRNPLAVAASIIETWGTGNWNLYRHKLDLFDGLASLIETYERNASSAHAVRYEDLLTDPGRTWGELFAYLGLTFDPSTLERFVGVRLRGRKGDPTGTRRYNHLSLETLNKWRHVLNNPLRKAWCRRYLRWLGRERLAVMGYDLDGLLSDLDSLKPSYRRVGSDLYHGCFGVAYDLLEPKIMKEKLRLLPNWNGIHAHK